MPAPAFASPTIVVKIDNRQPVELVDFTRSLFSLADQFKRDAAFSEGSELDVKLYVKELRPGSIIAELVPLVEQAMMVATPVAAAVAAHGPEVVDTVRKFVENFQAIKAWLVDGGAKPEIAEEKRVENFSNIVGPIAKDTGATIHISVHGANNAPITVEPTIIISSLEANAGQNRAAEYARQLKAPQAQNLSKVIMYWDQVRRAEENRNGAGERAIIEKVTERAVKVSFSTPALRELFTQGRDNPLKEAFVVDAEVQTVRGKIARYYVTALHERFPLDDDEENTGVESPDDPEDPR